MKKILITGFSGFVSNHFIDYLSSLDQNFEIIGITRSSTNFPKYKNLIINIYQGDLKDDHFVKEIVATAKPHFILHLASDSSVAYSWKNPIKSFQNNTNIFLNLIEAVRLLEFDCRILSIGSSEEYGVVNKNSLPLTEQQILNPISPYAVARASQEMLGNVYSKGFGLDIVSTRSFNHFGPGQNEKFVIASFVKQIIERKKGIMDIPLQVGNIDIIRDFLDVRDVVKAYWLLLLEGKKGEIYNVCSGNGVSLKEVIQKIELLADVDFSYEINTELVRPADNPVIIGSNELIKTELGWYPKITLEESLKDIINYWEKKYN